MENKKMKIIANSMLAALGLMLFICMFIPVGMLVIELRYYEEIVLTDFPFLYLSGQSQIGVNDEEYIAGFIIMCIISWAQLFISIATIVFGVLGIFKDNEILKKLKKVAVIAAIVVLGLYFIEGIITYVILVSNVGEEEGFTYVFLGVMICAPFIVLYFIFNKKSEQPVAQAPVGQAPVAQTQNAYEEFASTSTSEQSTHTEKTAEPTQANPLDEGALWVLNGGATKILRVYEDHVSLEILKNVRSVLTGNYFGGVKEIYYCDMMGVQYKDSSAIILGYIQFETANTLSKDNFNSENSFTFDGAKVSNELARQVLAFVRKKVQEAREKRNGGGTVVQQATAADELLKWKNLLDQGIISQEEFDAKKKELLGL